MGSTKISVPLIKLEGQLAKLAKLPKLSCLESCLAHLDSVVFGVVTPFGFV